ncbi:VOC family protein [Micromonospora sp. DSM 115977]|uniref:VOC family protein n=1 Tax=Micromonospora reichwaldensis TaxID=3075516 RepID=A0ABU2X046_9ACTN|nr:VOC family protein [Micromonospora sp. DSM 115977]MDT0531568.1 VOC family protein [Micromonospora sp. DSM 115977]
MYPRIHNSSFDCHDTYALSGSWPAVPGYARRADDGPGGPEVALPAPDGTTLAVFFPQVPGAGTVQNRAHVGLEPAGRTRARDAERVPGAGATERAGTTIEEEHP